jgi:phage-related protein
MRIGHGNLIHKIEDKVQEVVAAVVDVVQAAVETCTDAAKGVLTAALDVAKAAASGDMKGLVNACTGLATSIGDLISAPLGAAEQAVMGIVKKVVMAVANALPLDPETKKKMIDALTVCFDSATTIADMANPVAILTEGAKKAAGMPNSLDDLISDVSTMKEVVPGDHQM